MEIKWEPEAEETLANLIAYRMETAGERSAKGLLSKIKITSEHLVNHPQMGPIEPMLTGLAFDYRFLVADKRYKIIYRIEQEMVVITTLFDCRQNPDKLSENTAP